MEVLGKMIQKTLNRSLDFFGKNQFAFGLRNVEEKVSQSSSDLRLSTTIEKNNCSLQECLNQPDKRIRPYLLLLTNDGDKFFLVVL